jgi:hypothetical protein
MKNLAPCDAAFKQDVVRKCLDALSMVGFERYRKSDVDTPLGNGFHCWVGLNTGLAQDHVDINPFVGVHVVPIEKLWTSLKVGRYPGKYDRGMATYSTHLGKLAPKVPAFRFTRETDIVSEAKRLAELYATKGLEYAASLASYDRLLPLFQERVDTLGAYPERFAACLYLMDRKDDARIFVTDFLNDHRDYFEGFAIPFLKLMAN